MIRYMHQDSGSLSLYTNLLTLYLIQNSPYLIGASFNNQGRLQPLLMPLASLIYIQSLSLISLYLLLQIVAIYTITMSILLRIATLMLLYLTRKLLLLIFIRRSSYSITLQRTLKDIISIEDNRRVFRINLISSNKGA